MGGGENISHCFGLKTIISAFPKGGTSHPKPPTALFPIHPSILAYTSIPPFTQPSSSNPAAGAEGSERPQLVPRARPPPLPHRLPPRQRPPLLGRAGSATDPLRKFLPLSVRTISVKKLHKKKLSKSQLCECILICQCSNCLHCGFYLCGFIMFWWKFYDFIFPSFPLFWAKC